MQQWLWTHPWASLKSSRRNVYADALVPVTVSVSPLSVPGKSLSQRRKICMSRYFCGQAHLSIAITCCNTQERALEFKNALCDVAVSTFLLRRC